MMTALSDKVWSSIEVTVDPEATEAIEYLFNEIDSLGTEINHLRKRSAEATTVIGYFDESPDEETFQGALQHALRVYGLSVENVKSVERKAFEDSDWLAEWKKHWSPVEIGRFVVAPPWSDVDSHDRCVIRIEPNMAFGTGTHETTQLCMRAIEKYYKRGQSFLDVGSGTGILSIAAAMVGTSDAQILACDTDADSIKIARENAELNQVAGRIEFYVGSISEDTPRFDFVAANLMLDVIIPLLPMLLEKTGATLVMSGILADQERELTAELIKHNIGKPEVERAREWISVVVKRGRD